MSEPPEDAAQAQKYELAAGQLFDEYRIVRPLGKGGMGEVYEAEHTTLGLRYALKLLSAEFSARPGALSRFRNEARVMAQLQHPNLIKVDEFRETQGRYWLRMELAAGLDSGAVTLAGLAAQGGGKVEQDTLLDVLEQVFSGLAHAHRHGVVHRDLKPSNILLAKATEASRGRALCAKISDFGLVKLVGEDLLRTKIQHTVSLRLSMDRSVEPPTGWGTSARALLGTYDYMSPEQKRGEDVDQRSDVYSLGLITFRLLTGQQELGFELPSQLDDKLAPAWDVLVREALRPNREGRLASADEALSLLQRVRDQLKEKPRRDRAPTAVAEPPDLDRQRTSPQRRPQTTAPKGLSALPTGVEAREAIKTLARSARPETMLTCPVCEAAVKARALVRHYDKLHAGAPVSPPSLPAEAQGATRTRQVPPALPQVVSGHPREILKQLARSVDREGFVECPVCGVELKAKNLVRHYDELHAGATFRVPKGFAASPDRRTRPKPPRKRPPRGKEPPPKKSWWRRLWE